jgi:DNA-binding MarR family transcriptional regulator
MSRMQAELKQARPFSSIAEEAALALFRTADVVRGRIATVIEPAGITPQQYNVLRILRGAGEAGLPTLEIGERMVERTPGITRLLDRLEAKELVTRRRCAADKRQVLAWITPRGLRILAALDSPVRAATRRALAALRKADVTRLVHLLDAVRSTPANGAGPRRTVS